MAALISKLFQLKDQLILVFMLELLHFAIWSDLTGPLPISLLLMHLGLFLLWQPLWQGDERLRWFDILLLLVITYAFVFWITWWLIFGWIILLMGLTGGRITINRRERIIHMLTLIFLVFEILMRCTPMLYQIEITTNVSDIFELLLPIMPLAILLLAMQHEESRFKPVDFIHAISISTLTSLLVAGTLLNMYQNQTDYITALIQSLIVIGIFLMAISWLLIPRSGFSGLPQLWMKSMLNIGTPFESFLSSISLLFRKKSSPQEFLASTMDELIELPWVEGVEWTIEDKTCLVGYRARVKTDMEMDNLHISIFSYTPVSGALYFHCKLLIQIINNFYTAKLGEREMSQQIHLQAVYETGARITHDIKNLLQSLQAMTSIIVNDSEQDNFKVSGRLLKKQLPALTQRLTLALEKLQAPEVSAQESVYLKDWWNDLRMRTGMVNVEFVSELSGDLIIPSELFDSIIDNLLENIRNKAQIDEKVRVIISLYSDEHNVVLSIQDTGEKIPEEIAENLLKEPIKSSNGLGIGLYQATRQAESLGYRFEITHNMDGNVCFELSQENPSGQIDLI